MDQWHTQPSEFDNMPYYRIQYMEEDLKDLLEARKKAEETDGKNINDSVYLDNIMNHHNNLKANISKTNTGIKIPPLKI